MVIHTMVIITQKNWMGGWEGWIREHRKSF